MDILEEEQSYVTELISPNYMYNYKWTIKNYNSHNKHNGEFIMSPMFQNSGIECYLKLYPRGSEGYSEYISLFLDFKGNKNIAAELFRADFSILNNKLEIGHTATGTYSPYHGSPDICCKELIKRDIFLNPSNQLLVDNQLKIVCTVNKIKNIVNAPLYRTIQLEKTNDDFSLSNNLKESLDNEFLADITLMANGEKLRAHKFILASRSSVFAAMLQNNMKEKENSMVEIEDASADVLSKMLEYMYSDKVSNIEDHSEELLYIANKYDVKGLKLLSEQSIVTGLTIENFVKSFILAETHSCDKLKQEVLKFIIKNAFQISNDANFESWKKDLPAIVVDIIKAHA